MKYIITSCLLVFLVGCNSIPKDAFRLSETSLEDRRVQTRFFETPNEIALLSAGIAVLQDMGYSIDETEKGVGVIAASKNVDATHGGQIAAAVVIALLGGGSTPVDKEQKIKVCLITKPSAGMKAGYMARITFQRVIWNTQGQVTRVETLKDEKMYSEFFDKLSKSVFLEAHKI